MKPRMAKEEAYVLYQQLCDEVFGKGSVQIKPAPTNNVIGTLRHLDDFLEFKKNFKERLLQLRKRFDGTNAYPALLEQVKQLADPKNWEGAYAELAAYDVMWNDHVITPMELDITMPVSESYAGEMGYKKTNEDGLLPDYGLYFDVKILADTVGAILKGIINDAITASSQTAKCDILPEYPYDDDDEEYGGINRKKLFDELKTFLIANNANTNGKTTFRSSVIPRLMYRIQWGGGVNSVISEYNPYRHAEETKHLIFKRYIDADHVYYRSLARRTFCGYLGDRTPMSSIVPKFTGPETVDEVSRHLAGIIFINDNIIKENSYSCNVIMNPNSKYVHSIADSYLMSLVMQGDKRGLFDDLIYDNY